VCEIAHTHNSILAAMSRFISVKGSITRSRGQPEKPVDVPLQRSARRRHLGRAGASFGVLGSAAAIGLSIARWNGIGLEAAMPAKMGSLIDAAAIVIITEDIKTTSTSIMMRLGNCFVIT
jgi:hypothetical protein